MRTAIPTATDSDAWPANELYIAGDNFACKITALIVPLIVLFAANCIAL
jgi:hypothetical protein